MLDSFTVTKYDDGTKYVTEEGMPVTPAATAGRRAHAAGRRAHAAGR
ncbi:hypothetical protein OHB56_03300 [Streptomyces sp. NBC_01635]|nr:hypothetical protein OHB56_03300 [Streptomyces sp. NBC_01635]